MRNIILALLTGLILLPAQAQETLYQTTTTVVSSLSSGRDDSKTVSDKLAAIDGYVVGLLLSIANEFDITYNVPRANSPTEVLRKHTDCNENCSTPDMLSRGYEVQQSLVSNLAARRQGLLEKRDSSRAGLSDADRNVLRAEGEELLLLTWALKGNSMMRATGMSEQEIEEAVNSGEDDNFPPTNSIVVLAGTAAAAGFLSFCSTLGATADCIDTVAENAGGIGERRRQAAAVGIRYPNASWDCFWNNNCDDY